MYLNLWIVQYCSFKWKDNWKGVEIKANLELTNGN